MLTPHRCPLCRRTYLTQRSRWDLQPDDPLWIERIAYKLRKVWPDDTPEQIAARSHQLTDALSGLGATRIFVLIEAMADVELDLQSKGL